MLKAELVRGVKQSGKVYFLIGLDRNGEPVTTGTAEIHDGRYVESPRITHAQPSADGSFWYCPDDLPTFPTVPVPTEWDLRLFHAGEWATLRVSSDVPELKIRDIRTPVGFHSAGETFLDAAEMLAQDPITIVTYYVVCHSIELFLKAFLRGKGISADELAWRKYGHSLETCLFKARELGLYELVHFSSVLEAQVQWIGSQYEKKELEYPVTGGFKDFPDIQILLDIARRLATGIRAFCGEAMRQQKKDESG